MKGNENDYLFTSLVEHITNEPWAQIVWTNFQGQVGSYLFIFLKICIIIICHYMHKNNTSHFQSTFILVNWEYARHWNTKSTMLDKWKCYSSFLWFTIEYIFHLCNSQFRLSQIPHTSSLIWEESLHITDAPSI